LTAVRVAWVAAMAALCIAVFDATGARSGPIGDRSGLWE